MSAISLPRPTFGKTAGALFYQDITQMSNSDISSSVGDGTYYPIGMSFAEFIAYYFGAKTFSVSWNIAYTRSITFTGSGIVAFQDAGTSTGSSSPFPFGVDFLGDIRNFGMWHLADDGYVSITDPRTSPLPIERSLVSGIATLQLVGKSVSGAFTSGTYQFAPPSPAVNYDSTHPIGDPLYGDVSIALDLFEVVSALAAIKNGDLFYPGLIISIVRANTTGSYGCGQNLNSDPPTVSPSALSVTVGGHSLPAWYGDQILLDPPGPVQEKTETHITGSLDIIFSS